MPHRRSQPRCSTSRRRLAAPGLACAGMAWLVAGLVGSFVVQGEGAHPGGNETGQRTRVPYLGWPAAAPSLPKLSQDDIHGGEGEVEVSSPPATPRQRVRLVEYDQPTRGSEIVPPPPIPKPGVKGGEVYRLPDLGSGTVPRTTPPGGAGQPNGSPFPGLPPDPNQQTNSAEEELPPLELELLYHGGSYLYQEEGDQLGWPDEACNRGQWQKLRLPEDFQAPLPLTYFAEFLGADPINPRLAWHWPGLFGFQWEPRFVGYGSYSLFAQAFEQNDQRRDLIGHQLILEMDLALTGTERVHMQMRPIGENNTGGSYYQFNDPSGYVDNSTAVPQRYWIEAEFGSLLGGFLDPIAPIDLGVTMGKFPLILHNALLINDEILAIGLNKSTILPAPFSNLNVQVIYAPTDVNNVGDAHAGLAALNMLADYRLALIEATYAYLIADGPRAGNAHYLALSGTQFFGPLSLAGRALFKVGDQSPRQDGQLFVLESNYNRIFTGGVPRALGIEHAVTYGNVFYATQGWNSISGGNFNRLTTSFAVNPLVGISQGQALADTVGFALGSRLFRHHEDDAWIPEIALEFPGGTPVFGIGLNWQHKTGKRSFFEAGAVKTFTDDGLYRREGVMITETIVF